MEASQPRVVTPEQILPILERYFAAGTAFPLVITGFSMTPFLVSGRDRVLLRPAPDRLRRGDIAFYRRTSGRLVLHRVIRVAPEGYYFVGDAQSDIEGPISPTQILAIADEAQRKGRVQRAGCFWWEFFRHVWPVLLPVRRPIMRLYARLLHRSPAEN